MIIDKILVFALVLLITGVVLNVVFLAYSPYWWWDDENVYLIYIVAYVVIGCFSIFFNIISVIIP